ncbi:HeH/LEM domain protein [Acinetobacter sichuanensis]|uniref:HeH/LEM domain protein n=2 Tax=Acinetobacter sichuanensis TaxID=2136183 RepID=A0ABV7BI85_9GAMM
MKIIYAQKSAGIDEKGSFQNPKYFDRPDVNATSVLIYGDYPQIKAAYDALGVEVEVREVPERKAKVEKITVQLGVETSPELEKVLADTKAECEKVVAENEALQDQLKKAIADLETERAVHVAFMDDVDAMQARIDELKSAAANPDPSVEQSSEALKETQLPKPTENDFASWTIPQIKDYLAAKEIGFKASASKDELLALIPKE